MVSNCRAAFVTSLIIPLPPRARSRPKAGRARQGRRTADQSLLTWPFEGILAAVERGTLPDWRRLAKAIQVDPWGLIAQQVLAPVRLSRPYGTAELLEGVVGRARRLAAERSYHRRRSWCGCAGLHVVAESVSACFFVLGLPRMLFGLPLATADPAIQEG